MSNLRDRLVEIVLKEKHDALGALVCLETALTEQAGDTESIMDALEVGGQRNLGVALYLDIQLRIWELISQIRELVEALPKAVQNPITAIREMDEWTKEQMLSEMGSKDPVTQYLYDLVEDQPEDDRPDGVRLSNAAREVINIILSIRSSAGRETMTQ